MVWTFAWQPRRFTFPMMFHVTSAHSLRLSLSLMANFLELSIGGKKSAIARLK